MSNAYAYANLREEVFKPEGVRKLLKIRDNIYRLCEDAGACTVARAIAGVGGDSWAMLACIDYLIELGEIEYANTTYSHQKWIIRRRTVEA